MAVAKFVRFAAPYRSKTFNDKDNLIFGRNGVINGGEITQSLTSITIAPMTFVQSGLIVDVSGSLTANLPTMSAPYFVAVSVSTSIQNLAEVITPTFIKRPEDVNENVVLVAEYDGSEWRNLPRLQIDERIKEAANLNVQSKFTGITSGFDVVSGLSTLTVDTGTLIGADGQEIVKSEQTVLNKINLPALASSQYNRIDSIVFRKPSDAQERVGTIKQVVGPSYLSGSSTYVEAANNYGGSAVTQIVSKKSLIDTKIYTAYLEGTTLKMRIFDESLLVTNTFTITTLVDYYQFAPNFDGSIDIVYVKNTNLYYIRLDNTGAVVYLEVLLLSSSDVLHDCNIACVGSSAEYQSHIGVCREVGGTEREIGYFRIGSDGLTLTPYTVWIDLNANLQRLSFEVDNDDNLLYVAFDNVDTGRAYLRTFDAFTATPSAPPDELGSPVELQTEVWNNVSSLLMPTVGASNVKLVRTDNKELFAFWYHLKGSGVYGVAVYNVNFKSNFGYKAFILENTDTIQYSVAMDGMNRSYITSPVVGGGSIIKSVFDLNSLDQIGTTDTIITEVGVTESNVIFSARGDLLHNYGVATAGRWVKSTAAIETTLRAVLTTSSDILIAHNRKSDDALYVSDTIVGEEKSVKRLYELFNSFGAAGTVSWNIAGANKLVTSAITIRFLNRSATYTIAAVPAGTTIASGYACYVDIPDEDTSATLTMKVVQFGQGFIDRYGKRALPLFWNIGGRLFSNFSPYSFDSGGETVTLGSTMSDEFIAWSGSGDSAPNPLAHGYGSTNYITEATSHNAAIGLLDAAFGNVNQDRSLKLVRGGIWSWNSGTGALINAADAYIQVPGLNETRNTVIAQTISLTADGQVAYVTINRTGATVANLAVTVAAVSGLALTNNMVIIARRIGTDVVVGEHSMKLVNGESRNLDNSLSEQHKTLIGGSANPITEATSDPLWTTRGSPLRNILATYSTLDSIASLDAELNKFFGRLRVTPIVASVSKVLVGPANFAMLDGLQLTKEINGKLLSFGGATINFQTGVVLKQDDVTALGTNFTPPVIPVNSFQWFGVGLTAGTVNATNEYPAVMTVTAAASSNATLGSAPLPDITGDIKVAAVLIKNLAGVYTVQTVRQLYDQQKASATGGLYGYDAVVGSATQVSSGQATHPSLTSAIAGISSGGSILILSGYLAAEGTITVNKIVRIVAQGYLSGVGGTSITFNAGTADGSSMTGIRLAMNLIVNASKCNIHNFWIDGGFTINDNGTDNVIMYAIQ